MLEYIKNVYDRLIGPDPTVNKYFLSVSSPPVAFLAVLLQTHTSFISSIIPINRVHVHWNTSKCIVEVVVSVKTIVF